MEKIWSKYKFEFILVACVITIGLLVLEDAGSIGDIERMDNSTINQNKRVTSTVVGDNSVVSGGDVGGDFKVDYGKKND